MPFRNAAVISLARFTVIVGAFFAFGLARGDAPTVFAKMLPADLGSFHREGPVIEVSRGQQDRARDVPPVDFVGLRVLGNVTASYRWEGGDTISVTIVKFEDESAAYSRFTGFRRQLRQEGSLKSTELDTIGTASLVSANDIAFVQGSLMIDLDAHNREQAAELARLLASALASGEDDIPVLVKHLPQWETAERQADYAINLKSLKDDVADQPILDSLTFEAGAEAVTANYGPSHLVIVEFTTPQLSIENDSRIWTRIAELKSQGQPTPSAYRRVGNYSVFVFNAPDEKTANALVDQVKYEQVVQWLGDDPHLYDRLQRYLTQTSAGVLVAVLKSSGLSLIACLAIGGVIGTLLFRHRRAQRAAAFSDAGGAVRLNLDELTGSQPKGRLLSTSERPHDDRST
jgi:hypothetical protein